MNIKFYWINIDNSVHRRLFMEQQFKHFNIDNQRIRAITPEILSMVINDKPPYFCGNSSCFYNNCNDCKFEYACSASHLQAIKEGYNSGANYFIVCEDDIYFPFKIDFENLIKELPKDLDIFQMMVLDDKSSEKLFNDYYKKNINFIEFNPMERLFSTGMYLITRNGAEKILKLFTDTTTDKYDLSSKNIIKQADFLIYMNAKTYTSTFPFCIPNSKFISEIHPSHYHFHMLSINKIKENMLNDNLKNKFIIDYYNFDDFDKIFISVLSKY